ncbi:MAG: amidohydrolase family protein [Planctomycetota bacterium]|nr:amidohydrolase family protein [Planctomycetota bacterium]
MNKTSQIAMPSGSTSRLSRVAFGVGALLLSGAAASAQDLAPKAAPQTRPVLLRGWTVHTVAGAAIEGGDLLFEGGRIKAVSRTPLELDGDVEVIDATGKHVLPGFVLATSTLGLVEVESVDMTIDMTEAGSFNPEVYAAVAVNPDSWWLPVARRGGVMVAGVFPQGGVIPGRASVMQLDGWTWEDMALVRDAGLGLSWPGDFSGRFRRASSSSNAEDRIAAVDRLFDAAEAYVAAKAADPAIPTDLRYESMRGVLDGSKPVFVSLTTRPQAEAALGWGKRRGLRMAVVGGRDALAYVDLLKRHDVPVAITGTHRLPHRRDLSHRTTYQLPKFLESHGVRWCISMRPRDSANARNLVYEAAGCIAHGLEPDAALRAITLGPAEFLGVDGRVGSLEEGKDATVLLVDGDPFELGSRYERGWIQGREVAMEDKQTALYEKYREKYRQRGELPR